MTIKYFDFVCDNGHRFEGSFPSVDEMQHQLEEGLVRCPVCDTAHVRKVPSAAHLAGLPADLSERRLKELSERIMSEVRKAAEQAEDVGDDFAEESRRIQRGDSPRRLVKGRCTMGEARALLNEGITVLPIPESSGKTLN